MLSLPEASYGMPHALLHHDISGTARGTASPQVAKSPETVRSGAVDRVGVEDTKAARTWRLEGWRIGKGLHELGYREDRNLTLEYGVNVLLP
jgi:hypothetical protein